MVVPTERAEIKRGMERFIEDSLSNPTRTKNLVIKFIQTELERVDSRRQRELHYRSHEFERAMLSKRRLSSNQACGTL